MNDTLKTELYEQYSEKVLRYITGKVNDRSLADAMESLDKRSRDIIILHYYSRISLKEIAERLDISYTYAKILNAKALEALKKYFI